MMAKSPTQSNQKKPSEDFRTDSPLPLSSDLIDEGATRDLLAIGDEMLISEGMEDDGSPKKRKGHEHSVPNLMTMKSLTEQSK